MEYILETYRVKNQNYGRKQDNERVRNSKEEGDEERRLLEETCTWSESFALYHSRPIGSVFVFINHSSLRVEDARKEKK